MRTVDITIDDMVFDDLDAVARAAGMTPAEFARRATAAAVRSHKARRAGQRDELGYLSQPVQDEEFSVDPNDLKQIDDAAW